MTFQHRQKLHTVFTCIFAFILWLYLYFFELALPLDNALFDLRERNQVNHRIPSQELVIITIDDKSIESMKNVAGRWPWPRSVHAELIEGLNRYSPSVIAFDVLFNEPDIYRPDDDLYFEQVLNEANNVHLALLGLETSNQAKQSEYRLALFPFTKKPGEKKIGSVNVFRQNDAVVRQYLSKIRVNNDTYLSLGALIASAPSTSLLLSNTIKLKWQHQDKFKQYSYADIYNAVVNENSTFLQKFKNKRILIGATAAGLFDEVATPISNSEPGVFVIANAVSNYLKNEYYNQLSSLVVISSACVLMILFSWVYLFKLSLVRQFCLSTVVLALLIILLWQGYCYLAKTHSDLPLGALICAVGLAYISQFLMHSYVQYREKQYANRLFGRFLDPNVVKNLLDHQNIAQYGSSDIVEVTVLFSDIRNFTALSEKHDVTEVVALLNDYLSMQVATIFKHNGTLDKFIGDAVMAFWGAPIKSDNHAEQAILAALEMEQNLLNFRARLAKKYQFFDIGIGIHSGKVMCGFIGTDQRLDYTVLGDTVNLASRIEGLTKASNRILVSKQTAQRTNLNFLYVDKVTVKGREEPVELLTPER
ncbi:CHASE2 domain-containing protein [Pseudoalteromonas sp. SSM20]|uniref:CHASE2 domain-containing protein n=1 Tax=Pseudoalteromonas sp. SSM20 TaxID=3139394 RepID=UPI003BA84D85